MSAANYPGIGEIPKKRASSDSSSETLEDLRRQAAVAEARAEQAAELLAASMALKPPPAINRDNIPPPAPGEMPDPVQDPDGHRKWLATAREYDRWEARNYTNTVRDQEVNAGRSDRIIDGFLSERPKYRDLRPAVINAYREAALEMKLTAIPENTKALDALVDKKMRELVKAAAAAVDDLPTGDPKPRRETSPSRTEGLSAGSKGASSASRTTEDDEGEPVKSLYEVMRERQAKSNLF